MALLLRTALAGCLAGCAATHSANNPPELEKRLIAISQSVLDAVTAGDKTLFQRTLDPDGLFTDEEGTVRRGSALTEEITGLPPGYVGTLRIVDPHVRITGDVAVVTYEIAETLDLYGQRLNTRFHTTDVYQRTGEEWRLIAAHTSVLPSELARVPVDAARFEDYAGTYRLGADASARVYREGDKLMIERSGRKAEELIPIGGDRFIRAGARRGERFFRRDADGRVTEMVDRRDNNDLVWRRD